MRGLTILGSTGSIGMSTLDVVARHTQRFTVVALTANSQVERLFQQVKQFSPSYAVMVDEQAAQQLNDKVKRAGLQTQVLSGTEGLVRVASLAEVTDVMAAIVGAAGLLPTLAAAKHGKRVLLANKEALVMSGQLFMDEARENQADILPIDSEHNAIFQCMSGSYRIGQSSESIVKRILLTGSGGPFRTMAIDKLDSVTPEQACAHPNWDMGRKISVDSATMMNKGLELIEACWLFNTKPEHIKIVLHPQSIVHSMVEYADGSILAQMGQPDMRTPIAHALAWPERMDSGVDSLNLHDMAKLEFEEPDIQRFPALRLADEAMRAGGTMPAVLNAANEVAVQAFLDGRIRFTDITRLVEQVMSQASMQKADSLAVILDQDSWARDATNSLMQKQQSGVG
ncbi:MAG: 1-deoxy-D-xylulose-5-phosphate reductoisomerase [Thioalkalispiraceae bacterium]|jgi:1-deoxy-D-xylulose-5-phosphate reductoisomerase